MKTLHYFAYGSNLHFSRFEMRVPSARIINTASLPGHQLTFNKHGIDDSGKCNIIPADSEVHGVVYEIDSAHKAQLDQLESGYASCQIVVNTDTRQLQAFTYIAHENMIKHDLSPYHWYKMYVFLGAQAHGINPDYCSLIAEHHSIEDPDKKRNQTHFSILGIDTHVLNNKGS